MNEKLGYDELDESLSAAAPVGMQRRRTAC